MTMAAPPLPDDVQIVQPDPSLPKEIADFWGKWEGTDPTSGQNFFLIVEKIDEKKANLYIWRSGVRNSPGGWDRKEAEVIKEYGKYKLTHRVDFVGAMPKGSIYAEYVLKGKYLESSSSRGGGFRYTRVP
jgi:hypothetical protein